ncbi:DUF262 domain-containing protein [Hymenobacter glacieicola]|uniref:GmrSD restriction endonucleases N-terminal domain-containing protein n=1 Tax=Hymenobacter glacieicola TaxID=1562124 RepID=A0ABQ1WLR4_9BACT|nr:DUF262 domain-containing protein [Hymenobacter glacieicola]GGG35571.1 hypothetical protein GCM10011378_09780 [Hymenobacter glacieicola]
MPISNIDNAQISFWELIKDMRIRIPLLQRDYAQGREDRQAALVRKLFLDALYEALTQAHKAPLRLDFVYGQVENTTLLPLDGQQRLTTLFLLHWYAAAKARVLSIASERLRKFSYQTRRSSRDFCLGLVGYQPILTDIANGKALQTNIEDAAWFQPTWRRDPTVKAMLVMLAAIHDKFQDIPDLFACLTTEPAPVGFHFLNLTDVGLTDDLYLKMNARGKPLTSFEKWKAAFDQLLARHENVHQDFARKMDNEWLDFFWRQYQDAPERLDQAFEDFIDFCTRMLGARQQAGKKKTGEAVVDSFDLYRQVYADEANVRLLEQMLDQLTSIPEMKAADYFGQLFTTQREQAKVQLFGNGKVHLMAELKNADYKVQLLLYALLQYGVRVRPLTAIDDALRDYVRVIRNYLEGRRRRRWWETSFVSDLDADNLSATLADLDALVPVATKNIYDHLATATQPQIDSAWYRLEQEKAQLLRGRPELKEWVHQLEDLTVFRGQLTGFKLAANPTDTHGLVALADKLPELAQAAVAIWSDASNSNLTVRALIAEDDYSFGIGNDRWFFGSASDLYPMLTDDSQKKGFLPQFLQRFADTPGSDASARLQLMIDRWLESATPQTEGWRYYFVRYPAMTSGYSSMLYHWPEDRDYELRCLSKSSLKGFHINPYVRTVIRLLNDSARCSEEGSRDHDREWSPLWLYAVPTMDGEAVDLPFYCEQQGWRLDLDRKESLRLAPELIARFSLTKIEDLQQYWLSDLAGSDRIKTAIQFIDQLYRQPLLMG